MLQLGSPSSSAFLKVLLLSLLHTHPSIFTDFTSRLRCAKHHSVSLSVQPLMSIKLIPGAQPLNALLCLHNIKWVRHCLTPVSTPPASFCSHSQQGCLGLNILKDFCCENEPWEQEAVRTIQGSWTASVVGGAGDEIVACSGSGTADRQKRSFTEQWCPTSLRRGHTLTGQYRKKDRQRDIAPCVLWAFSFSEAIGEHWLTAKELFSLKVKGYLTNNFIICLLSNLKWDQRAWEPSEEFWQCLEIALYVTLQESTG